jgi:hypothetical protein
VTLTPSSTPGGESASVGLLGRIEQLELAVYGRHEDAGDSDESGDGQSGDSGELSLHALESLESNRNDVRSRVADGGWEIVWGVNINEAEYAKFAVAFAASVASGNVGALAAYFKNDLDRSIDKFLRNAPGIAKDALRKAVMNALKDRGQTIRVGKIGVKGGIATYKRWEAVSIYEPDGMERYKIRLPLGGWTWGWRPKFKKVTNKLQLPNHHQPYVGFRLF